MPSLDFKGKSTVYSYHLGVPFRDLRIDEKKSLPGKGRKASLDDNLIVHGDNLHALKSLLPRYAGKIKCIYIDPPYNTGNEGWKYNDNVNSPLLKEWFDKEVGLDDLERHDKWLCMMWPRLQLLKELLSDDGVIFVSIDDNEQHRLRTIMDEIFGEENFIGNIAWKKTTGDNKPNFAFTHDNILIYGKSQSAFPRSPLSESQKKQYTNPDRDSRGAWAPSDYRSRWTRKQRPNLYYPVVNPNTGEEIYPDSHTDSERVWGTSREVHVKNEKNNLIWWGKDGKSKEPKKKRFLTDHKGTNTRSVWTDAGTNDSASIMLRNIFQDQKVFDTPKPVSLVRKIINLMLENDTVVLDSFAGSGTTAHAVLDLNKEDGGNRKFILVECEDYADKITAERVRRVIKGVPNAKDDKLKEGLGGSFAYCTLGDEINDENILFGKKLPSYEVLAKYVFYTATGQSIEKVEQNEDYFISTVNGNIAFFLIYKPNRKFLRSNQSALNLDRKGKVENVMKQKKCDKAIVFAPACFYPIKELSQYKITFCQLPFDIHRIIGG